MVAGNHHQCKTPSIRSDKFKTSYLEAHPNSSRNNMVREGDIEPGSVVGTMTSRVEVNHMIGPNIDEIYPTAPRGYS